MLTCIAALAAFAGSGQQCHAQRVLGIDVSAWQSGISQTDWNSAINSGNRQFVFIRSSRGGTTGYDYRHDGLSPTTNAYTGSQRYDDPYFGQNITRATNAGLFAGTYHFARPDIIAGTLNSNGTVNPTANTGADEADHFIQMASAWMRPGYLPPVLDLEVGFSDRTPDEMLQFSLDFSDRIYEVMGIRPAMYTGGSNSLTLQGASLSLRQQVAQVTTDQPSVLNPAFSALWNARYVNQDDPESIPIQTSNPKASYNGFYGPWDDFGDSQPWTFWQYASTGEVPGFINHGKRIDVNVSQGDIEVVKDHLIPAVWLADADGNWSTLANWNSGQTPVAPLVGRNQTPVQGTTVLPTARLPGAAGSGPTAGSNDTVILERPDADVTVTVSTGTHNIRKLYMRESLAITGGTLTVNYDPHYVSDTVNYPDATRSGPLSAQFSGPVTLSGAGNLNAHTVQVDAQQTFTVGGAGTLSLAQLNLMPHSTNPARLLVSDTLNFDPLSGAAAVVANGAGSGAAGKVDLGGGQRTIHVGDGAAATDLQIAVPVVNGSLVKAGPGTLSLTGANAYAGDTAVQTGTLRLGAAALANSGAVAVTTGASLDLDFAGTDTIRSLEIDGAPQATGTWGAVGSGAEHTAAWITGGGLLNVTNAAAPLPGLGSLIDDFETDEGHFGWAYNYSPGSQTFGLTGDTTIERVTTEAHTGDAAQELQFVAEGGAWQIRHVSGIGAAAAPEGNVEISTTGSIGFWLKTDDPGVTVQIAVDDPTSADRGLSQAVIADGQWHLYQWDLEDDSQWEGWATGDGLITEATLTIDSIFFAGNASATVYLDDVSHNPLGALAGPAEADFNADASVDGDDLAAWHAGLGIAAAANRNDGDADGDRAVTGADFLIWQRGSAAAASAAAHSVPEPAALALILMALSVGAAGRFGSHRPS